MGAKEIYIKLREAGLTTEGACGLMGNMQAESAMRANNAQDGMTGLTDAEYTAAADAGTIDFVRDATGYGLCQWTYWSRKQALLDFARARGVSVGDEAMQVDFCLDELRTSYPRLLSLLKSTNDIYEAASEVCTVYERPAQKNIAIRADYAQRFYYALSIEGGTKADTESDTLKETLTNETVMHLQAILVTCGYNIGTQANSTGVDGYIGKKTVAAAKDFVTRLEAMV